MQLLLSLTIPAAAQGQRNHVAKTEAKDDHGIITSPGEGQRKVYARSGWSYKNVTGLETVEQDGTVQIVECEDGSVYIRNILYSFPTGSWVKGTREGTTITVPAGQPIYWNDDAEITFSIRWGVCEEGIAFSLDQRHGVDQRHHHLADRPLCAHRDPALL